MTVYELMKDSNIEWIGEIPNHWEIKPLKRVITDRSGGAWGEDSKHDDNDRICMRIADFDFDRGIFKDKNIEDLTVRNYPEHQINSLTLKKGDIVVEKSGGGEKTPVGRAVLFDKDYLALYANFTDRIRVDSKVILPKFMEYWWRTMYFKTTTTKYIKQTTGIQNLDMSSLLRIEKICFPLKEEQMRIISYLDSVCLDIDTAITEAKASIEDYKLLKQSIITQAVTKGLNPNVPMKDSGIEWIGEIPEYWNCKRLKYLISFLESGVSVNAGQNEAGNNELGVLKTSCVTNYYFDVHQNKSVNKDEENRVSCPVKGNTIIVSRMNTPQLVGACGYVKEDSPRIFLPDRLWQVHFKPEVNVKYIYYYLCCNGVRCYYTSLSTGTSSSMQNLSQNQFYNVITVIPELKEQNEIVKYLDTKCNEIESMIKEKETMIADLEAYKKSLIFEVVTGKRKVC